MKKGFLTIIAAAASILIGYTTPTQAANFQLGDANVLLGGSLRYDMGYKFSDVGSTSQTPTGQVGSKTNFFSQLPVDNRFLIGVSYDKIRVLLDLAIKGEETSSNAVTNRQMYFSYDMGGGNSLLVGQTYSILSAGAPRGQALNGDLILRGYGNLDHLRAGQVRFTHSGGSMTYQLAVEMTRSAFASTSTLLNDHVEEKKIPAVVAAVTYSNKENGITITPSGYFQTYDLTANQTGVKDLAVTSWAAALNAEFATRFVTFSCEGWYGQNLSTLGPSLGNNDNRPSTKRSTIMGVPYAMADGTIRDVRDMGGWVQFSFPVKPVTIYVGAGYQREEIPDMGPAYESYIQTKAVFTSVKIPIYKGFFIQPEIVWFDHGNDAKKQITSAYAYGDNKLGSDLYAGIHYQYDF